MADAEKALLANVTKLIAIGKDLHSKLGATLDELDALLDGKASIATDLKRFQQDFDSLWGSRYAGGQTGRYIWRHVIDLPNMKRLLKALGLAELTDRAVNYLRSEDPFLMKNRHPFGLFVSGINSYANDAPSGELDLSAPVDCRHTPRCGSDQAHTARKMAEARG